MTAIGPIARIVELVAVETQIPVQALREPYSVTGVRGVDKIVHVRQLAMWVARQATLASYAELGRMIGYRDHSTVMHGIRMTDERRKKDPVFKALSERLLAMVDMSSKERALLLAAHADEIAERAKAAAAEKAARAKQAARRPAARQRDAEQRKDTGVHWGSQNRDQSTEFGTYSRRYFIEQNERFSSAMMKAIKEGEPLPQDVVFAKRRGVAA